ncbi:MAG: type I pullulanase [Coprobacillus sp.]|nr:type I pullulanase [Coprobacillus sp.]
MKKKSFKSVAVLAVCALLCVSGCNKEDSNTVYGYPQYDEDAIVIHYYRADANYSDWSLWLWSTNADGAEYDFNGMDSYGAVASYPLSTIGVTDITTEQIGFIVKARSADFNNPTWTTKDIDSDRFIDLTAYDRDENGEYHVYLKSGDANIYNDPDGGMASVIKKAEFSSYTRIAVTGSVEIESAVVYENGKVIKEQSWSTPTVSVGITLDEKISIENVYTVDVNFVGGKSATTTVSMRPLFSTNEFIEQYGEDGELGAIYTSGQTEFRVWSPVSSAITLRIYESGTPKSVDSVNGNDTCAEYPMVKADNGTFEYTLSGDQAGKYYTYVVTNASYTAKEIVDPYAKSAGINGLRGMVVNFDSSDAKPEGWDDFTAPNHDRKELTVYETHVVDITSSETWGGTPAYAKTYQGAYETGTTYTEGTTEVKTGFDHIVDLGVNAVQLQPVFDQANEEDHAKTSFNWGYNPLNYNVVEGSYSSDPYDGYARIKEFRELVMAYGEKDISIIMDVVYNHVNGAIQSNFDVLMPGYYFRYNDDGSLSSGSGCGNDTASELPMYHKFMVDSTSFWAETYKLSGFRFDLMGLHDTDTMNDITEACQEINENIVIYGEPWTMTTASNLGSGNYLATQSNAKSYGDYGQFNDAMRDALIKGGLNSVSTKGWITDNTKVSAADVTSIIYGIDGYTGSSTSGYSQYLDADKTNNYVSCHDNYTLYDRCVAAGIKDEETIAKMAVLANAMVFTSKGTSFMLAGEEFLRTKNVDGGDPSNSYQSSYKCNELDYSLLIKNASVYENYKALIKAKQEIDGLGAESEETMAEAYQNVTTYEDGAALSYHVEDEQLGDVIIIHHNGVPSIYGDEGITVDLSGYTLYLDTLGEYSDATLTAQTVIKPYQTIIAYKTNP